MAAPRILIPCGDGLRRVVGVQFKLKASGDDVLDFYLQYEKTLDDVVGETYDEVYRLLLPIAEREGYYPSPHYCSKIYYHGIWPLRDELLAVAGMIPTTPDYMLHDRIVELLLDATP
jgi:hypothetical protein